MNEFMTALAVTEETRILDVGGTPYNWQLIHCPAQITLLNLTFPEGTDQLPDNFELVAGDGTQLEYEDNAFDIVFSNSVIEHLYTWENQQRFSQELRRVARRIWVQTPARWFPVEPHLITLFIHYLPRRWMRPLLSSLTGRAWLSGTPKSWFDQYLKEVRLLTASEMRSLFPDCELRRERFLGLTKSFVAVRREAP